MGSLERRLGAVEEKLMDRLMVEMMVEAEIQVMLQVLEVSEAIEPPLYEKAAGIITTAAGR